MLARAEVAPSAVTNVYRVDGTPSWAFRMQRTTRLEFRAVLNDEASELELALD